MNQNCLLYFVKYPEPGKVKTRLAKTLGDREAARIYRELAEENFHILHSLCSQNIEIAIVFDPSEKEQEIKQWFPDADHYLAQQGRALGERLIHAFAFVFQKEYERVITIGSDILGLTAEIILQGFSALENHEVVLGPALDGGYYLIGLNHDHPELFEDIPWSTDAVLDTTIAAVKKTGLAHYLLCALGDLDEIKEVIAEQSRNQIDNT